MTATGSRDVMWVAFLDVVRRSSGECALDEDVAGAYTYAGACASTREDFLRKIDSGLDELGLRVGEVEWACPDRHVHKRVRRPSRLLAELHAGLETEPIAWTTFHCYPADGSGES